MNILPTGPEAKTAATRIAIRQVTNLTKEVVAASIARYMGDSSPDGVKKALAFLSSPMGTGLLQGATATALPLLGDYLGSEYKGKIDFIASELRISAMTEIGDTAAESFLAPLRGMLFDAVSGGKLKAILDSVPDQLPEKNPVDAEFTEVPQRISSDR